MGGLDMGGGGGGGRHKKVRSKRMSVRNDMTPMVDVAFLLLTFFMLTTVFSQPQAMEINMPDSKEPVEIAESNVLQVRVDQRGDVYWGFGREAPTKAPFTDIEKILLQNANRNPEKTVTVLKVDREGTYKNAVDILDAFETGNVKRFAIAPMTEEDRTLITAAGGQASPVAAPAVAAAAPPAAP